MPWLLKGLLVLAKSRVGRRLLIVASLALVDLAKRSAKATAKRS
jgi:hypothetical protein